MFRSLTIFLTCVILATAMTADALRLPRRRSSLSHIGNTSNATSPLPRMQCSWPYMCDGCPDMNPNSTLQAQHMLMGYLKKEPNTTKPCDGVFGPETKAMVEEFQRHVSLKPVDGVLGPETWLHLASGCSGLHSGADANNRSTELVRAAQVALNFNAVMMISNNNGSSSSFRTPVTGRFDAAFIHALRNFQIARGANVTSGLEVDYSTWHLLTTGCNASVGNEGFWFDAGWPQGVMSLDTMRCLREQAGMRFMVQECWVEGHSGHGHFWMDCPENIANARAAGFESAAAYMFPSRDRDPVEQVRQLIGNLSSHHVDYDSAVMLDIEGGSWSSYTHAENRVFILAIKSTLLSLGVQNIIVYCGREWPTFFGHGFDAFSNYPLIYAHYDLVPSFYDWQNFNAPGWYGGWQRPAGKQFWDGVQGISMCGLELDWDWSDKPFWRNF